MRETLSRQLPARTGTNTGARCKAQVATDVCHDVVSGQPPSEFIKVRKANPVSVKSNLNKTKRIIRQSSEPLAVLIWHLPHPISWGKCHPYPLMALLGNFTLAIDET